MTIDTLRAEKSPAGRPAGLCLFQIDGAGFVVDLVVPLADFPQHPAGAAHGHHVRRNILGHDAARTAETVAASAALPIDVFGENHVQELCANFDAGAYCGKPSHFIGHLQTNKIKKVLGRASLIQSVDSEHLLAAIEKEAAKAGIVQNVLLEVNIGGEESKTGVAPEALWPLLDAAAAQEHIRVKGLMAIPPVNDDDAQNRRYLAQVYKLFVQAGEHGYQNVAMETLSMGMSGDFENAIREGATLVRIGTAIYGERDYSKKG